MRDHNAARCQRRIGLAQGAGDIVIAEPVKAVAPDTLIVECVRNRIDFVHARHGPVEGGVETGDLGGIREGRAGGADPGQAMRLMQGGQRHQGLERRLHGIVDHHRGGEIGAAMDDAVAA